MQKHIIGLMLALVIGMIGVQAPVQASSSSSHKVENGDTLWDIAEANEVSVDDLFTWNELTSPLIFPEQEIKIASTYTVKKGDTLSAIAQAHNIKLEDLMRWNNNTSHLIYPGEELVLNGKKATNVTAQNNANNTASPPPAEKKTTKQAAAPPPKENTKKETKSKENNETQTTSAPSGKEMTVTATAYTAYCEGCSGVTYTGIDLRANPNQRVIAVDPNIIPLGSRVWVEGYGEAIAGDIGGAIKGNIIDVFIENQQDALNWGRRTVTIKILN